MVASSLLMLAAASHVLRAQMSDVAHQMRERRRRILLMDLLLQSRTPLTTQTRTKVERSPNGWLSSTMSLALKRVSPPVGASAVSIARVYR